MAATRPRPSITLKAHADQPGTDLFDLVELTEELEALLKVDIISVGGLTDRDDHIRSEAVPLSNST